MIFFTNARKKGQDSDKPEKSKEIFLKIYQLAGWLVPPTQGSNVHKLAHKPIINMLLYKDSTLWHLTQNLDPNSHIITPHIETAFHWPKASEQQSPNDEQYQQQGPTQGPEQGAVEPGSPAGRNRTAGRSNAPGRSCRNLRGCNRVVIGCRSSSKTHFYIHTFSILFIYAFIYLVVLCYVVFFLFTWVVVWVSYLYLCKTPFCWSALMWRVVLTSDRTFFRCGAAGAAVCFTIITNHIHVFVNRCAVLKNKHREPGEKLLSLFSLLRLK